MKRFKTEGTEKISFEVFESNNQGVVFKRVIPEKGRKLKEVHKIEMSMPTATVRYFDIEDFENLKRIEGQIHAQFIVKSRKQNVLEQVIRWLDVK